MDTHCKILAAFQDGRFLVLVEQAAGDPTNIRLRVARLLFFNDEGDGEVPYWSAPYLARAMRQAASFYEDQMEKARKELEGSTTPVRE